MKQLFLSALLLITAFSGRAQTATPDMENEIQEAKDIKPKFGIKTGYNIAKITGHTPNYSPDTKNGFMVSAFYAPANKSGIGYRSEIVFSRQGFGFDEAGKTTSVTNDYVYLPQFTTFGITKYVQLQVGGQIGYLLKSSKELSAAAKSQDLTSFTNRIDYGAAAGVEIYPIKHLIIGGRYNYSFGNTYKQPTLSGTPIPYPLPFTPADIKGRNAVINLFVGVRF